MQTTAAFAATFVASLICLAQQAPDPPKTTQAPQAAPIPLPATGVAVPPPPPLTYTHTIANTFTEPDFAIIPIEGDESKAKVQLKTSPKTASFVEVQRAKNSDGTLSSSRFYYVYENGDYLEYERKEAGISPDGQPIPAKLEIVRYTRSDHVLAGSPRLNKITYYSKVTPFEVRFVEGNIQYWLKYDDKKPPANVHPFTKINTSPLAHAVGLGGLNPVGGIIVNTLHKKAIQGGEFEANYANFPTIWRLEATKDDGFVVTGGYDRAEVKKQMEEAALAHGGAKGKIQ